MIVSTVSVAALVLVSTVSMYLYSNYARPETVSPDSYEKEIFSRVERVENLVRKLKDSHHWNSSFSIPLSGRSGSLINIDPVLPVNPIKTHFQKVSAQALALAAIEDGNDRIEEKDLKIDRIEFHPKSVTLQHEITIESAIDPDESGEKVTIKQVGLSLGMPSLAASIHRIQNLFGQPGLIGHLYILETRKSEWNRPDMIKIDKFNFSSKEKFSESLRKNSRGSFDIERFSDNQKYSLIYFNSKAAIADNFLLKAIEPEENSEKSKDVDFVNPYKWLYMATRPSTRGNMREQSAIVALVFPREQKSDSVHITKKVEYPADVNLFPIESLSRWDRAISEANEQRALNHSKTMLSEEDLLFFELI